MIRNLIRRRGGFGTLVLSGLLLGFAGDVLVGSVLHGEEAHEPVAQKPAGLSQEGAPAAAAAASAPQANDGACIAGAAAIEDLRQLRERLAQREKELAAKEGELKALEKAVHEEFERLEQARADIARVDALKKKENEEKVAKIVETLETMSPKAAAQMLAGLDDALAVTAMQRMATPRLAKVMNLMEPGRSSRLAELLAGVVRVRGASSASNGAAATTLAKGGENK